MNTLPRVSIITINYNQLVHTCALLDSLRKLTYRNVEVIVVDNASAENPSDVITSRYPEVKLVVSPTNLGFAGGNNLGISASTGDYLLFLNNDTETDPGFLEPLVSLFETNPQAGAASPKILYYNTGIIQYAGSTPLNPLTGRNKRIGYQEKDCGQHDCLKETGLAHGAAMMVPRRVIDRVGKMPELFFLYYEEIDWCEQIKKAGYKIYFVPASKVYHKESMSIGRTSPLKTYYLTRNRLLFMRRHTTGTIKILWILFFLFISLPKHMLAYVFRLETKQGKAFLKGLLWNLTHFSNGEKRYPLNMLFPMAYENRN